MIAMIAVTLASGDRAWINPDTVEALRPIDPKSQAQWPEHSQAIVTFTSGNLLAVRDTVDGLAFYLMAKG